MRGPTRPVAVTCITKVPGTALGAASAAAKIASRGAIGAGEAASDSAARARTERDLIIASL